MVGPDAAAGSSAANGTARRLRKNRQGTPDTVTMTTVTCDQCGAQFAIGHRSAFQDSSLAQRQAIWLADKFVWDHIQETKHHGSIRLPEPGDMK